ncbi:unnamed protein product [Adineta steineri]|uniref:Uncharacterized protein n=1 Tax=Adineta steineri TaxID=433720 RepID=A0A819LXN6_9BILA|nr:unnamed protein product [Adineta steineri]CAF3969251.1 unnamed protein product [Adineta steineri]
MTCSKQNDKISTKSCKYDIECDKNAIIKCEGCEEMFCEDHYSKHENKIAEDIEYLISKQNIFNEQLKLFLSKLSANDILNLIKYIYQFKIKSDFIEKQILSIKNQYETIFNQKKSNHENNQIENENFYNIEDFIQAIKKDLQIIFTKFQQISAFNSKDLLEKQTDNQNLSQKQTSHLQYLVKNSLNHSQSSSNELQKQISSPPVDSNKDQHFSDDSDNEFYSVEEEEDEDNSDDDDDGIKKSSDSIKSPVANSKIRLSNNIVRWLRGPFKLVVNGTMHAVDVCAQGTHISENVLKAVKRGLEKQSNNNNNNKTYVDINSDWIYEGENTDRGFTSPSIWMKNPLGERVLIKIQEHPLCAANEWIAYVLGDLLNLPVNQVQIGIYKNELVSVHKDVALENEKTLTYMDLPKDIRKLLLSDSRLECMDLFDHIIQNVDRNQRNILITLPKTDEISDDLKKFKIHLIDHSSCFGMGKLNGLSVVACKFHSNHLSVVKFHPTEQAKKFQQYLNKLTTIDKNLIKKTLNRFASITNEQFDNWITEIQDLLSSSQYNRIHNVLYRQRDITRNYTIQLGIFKNSLTHKSNQMDKLNSETNQTVTYF